MLVSSHGPAQRRRIRPNRFGSRAESSRSSHPRRAPQVRPKRRALVAISGTSGKFASLQRARGRALLPAVAPSVAHLWWGELTRGKRDGTNGAQQDASRDRVVFRAAPVRGAAVMADLELF